MREYLPLLIIGGVIGTLSAIFILAFALMKDKKEAIGFDRNMKDSELIKRLARYAKPFLGKFAFIFLLMLFSIVYDVLSPLLVGKVEETVSAQTVELPRLFILVGVYVLALLFSVACTYAQRIMLQKVGQQIISAVREDTFVHIESLSHEQLNHIPVGKLVTRVTNDSNSLSMLFTNIVVNLFRSVLSILGIVVAMLLLNYELTLMVLCFVPFIVLFTVIFRKFSRRAYRRVKDCTTDINTYLSEHLSGMKIIQVFNREDRKMAEFSERNNQLKKAKFGQIYVFGIFRPMVYMLYISSIVCLLYLSARGYIYQTSFLGQVITSSTLVTFYMYIERFFNPIQNLAEMFNWMQSAFASAEKIFTICDMVPEIQDAPDAVELETIEGKIEFKHVWFAYEKEEWVLKDVTFTVEPGETVAFVGATGSGKTTILSLICRNYDIQKGQILIDGRDIRSIKVSSLRSHFGQMLQDVFLFSGTIRSNITLNEESFTEQEIIDACRYVNASSFIAKLKNGLDEEVRERGNNFSAGQRQLLSFARTVLHKPEVMILDEATANIDTETEVLIQDSLEKIMKIGTMLMVAHRLSTVQHADKIIVLAHGEILEQGNHFELLAKKGRYYDLYRLQYHKEQLLGKRSADTPFADALPGEP